jgi:hypothetical protein
MAEEQRVLLMERKAARKQTAPTRRPPGEEGKFLGDPRRDVCCEYASAVDK